MATTPMMQQYQAMKARHPDAVLLFQLGDFYETFYEDAQIAARELDIVLTSRDDVPMAGVPVRKAEVYVQRLLSRGHKVALCSQTEPSSDGKRLLKRQVVRVFTPGTVLEEAALEADVDALLAALWVQGDQAGLAWTEAVSGAFHAQELPAAELEDRLASLPVREWLLPEGTEIPEGVNGLHTRRPGEEFDSQAVTDRFPGALPGTPLAAQAAGAILNYLEETTGTLPHLAPPELEPHQRHMTLDAFTQRSLELTAPLRPEGRTTLFSVLCRARTPMGRRALRRWILTPLQDLARIQDRLDVVEFLKNVPELPAWGEMLAGACDLPRLIGRAGTRTLAPRELLLLGRAQSVSRSLAERFDCIPTPLPPRLAGLVERLGTAASELAEEIARSILDEPAPDPGQGRVIRSGRDASLDRAAEKERELRSALASLEMELRGRTRIGNLRIAYNKVLGYYLEVTRSHLDKVPAEWRRRQSLTGGERYTCPELESIADQLLAVEVSIRQYEERILEELAGKVRSELRSLVGLGEALAEFDVLRGLAEVALSRGYVRPRFTDRSRMRIVEGRHPAVELSVSFVPNDLELDEHTRLAVVTGPNMAGKSVFLRQAALIALMAQMGSFVPAKEAALPLFDRIYTRVGASDAVAEGLSTFMAEMHEAAAILRGATERSLVVLDELGRGTSTHDGMALAWGIARHLAEEVRGKTLFATHYRELARLADEIDGACNLHAKAREWKGEVVFLHRIAPGVSERSYGLHVARLAQLPESVLREAERVLDRVERPSLSPEVALPLFEPMVDELRDELRHLDPDRLTPLEALAKLADLARRAR